MSQTTSKLNNGNDTYTNGAAGATQTTNFSTSAFLALRTGGFGNCYSYIYFAKPFPPGATIISATLRVRNPYAETGSKTITLKKLTGGWTLSKTNYLNAPGVTATDSKALTKTAPAANTEWAFDVTTHMQAASDGAAFYGWRMELNNTTVMYLYSTQANTVYKPTLEVVWSTAPDAPSKLAPSGNRAVSVDKPILRFDFTDTAGNTALQAIQVQINATNVWTSPGFDSGTVSTNVPQLDLTTTAYAGLADGSSTYWRVRVQDGSGQWSGWSVGTQFKRVSKGTLAMDNPPSGGNITEATPPVLWTFTGRTQKSYQVKVLSAAGAVLHDSGKIVGTGTAYTIPAPVIKASGVNYTFVLNVWDNQDRETTPNDPPYVQISRVAPYVFSASVAGVTALTATASTPLPGVSLAWSRSTAPDSFVVWRDGEILYHTGLPGDWNTGATTYAVKDPYADPQKVHTYFVQAVVNGVASSVNPTATATPRTSGIWLTDVARNIQVQILGTDEGTWSMREQSAVYAPVGGTKSVLVTQALGGYEGSISGVIVSHDAVDVDAEESKLWLLKSTPGALYVLTLANLSMMVIISNLEIIPTPDKEIQKKVSFKFYQQSNLPFTAVL